VHPGGGSWLEKWLGSAISLGRSKAHEQGKKKWVDCEGGKE